jgi:hypothetical protein
MPTATSTASVYKETAALALTIGQRMSAWIAEIEQLEALPSLTTQQKKRMADLSSALDSYESAITDGTTELPKKAWVARAMKEAA